MAGLVFCAQNPLSPLETSLTYPVNQPITIRQWLDNQGITEFGIPTICYYNGVPTLRAQWLTTVIHDNDRVIFMPILQGGGGGGSNPLRAILTIALMVAAPMLGGIAAGALGVTSAIGVSLVTAGVMAAGTALINAVVPAPKPQTSLSSFDSKAESPTYNITAQGNQARIDAPIPVIYGRHLIYPDFVCMPFSEYEGNEQYLYQAFMIGQGEYDVGKLMIEDSPASSFAGFLATRLYNNAYTAWAGMSGVPASANLAYFHRITSAEVSGQELLGANETGAGWVGPFVINSAGSEINSIEWDVIAPHGLGYTNDDGSYASRSATFELQYQPINDDGVALQDWQSGAVSRTITGTRRASANISPATRQTLRIDLGVKNTTNHNFDVQFNNVSFPTFIPHAVINAWSIDRTGATDVLVVDATAQQHYDYYGNPYWITAVFVDYRYSYSDLKADAEIVANNPKAIRRTYKINVAPGRYQVRMKRTNNKDTNSRAFDEIRWAGLKGRLVIPPTRAFNNKTILLTRLKATDSLSAQQSRKINAIVTRKLAYYALVNGVPTLKPAIATRSIVWAMLDILTASYGAKQKAVDIIDLKALIALDNKLRNISYYCDIVIDSVSTVWDALKLVARLGRAVPVLELGKVRIVRDEQRTVPVALFSPANIKKGSFSIDYIMPSEDTADTIKVEYFDGQKWKPQYKTSRLSDSAGQTIANVQLLGCTSAMQAQNEGLYMAANNRYRREFVTFSTEMDGFIPRYGDLIKVVHDIPEGWGQHAEVVSYDAANKRIMVHPPLDWTDGEQHMIAFRTKTGALTNAVRCGLYLRHDSTDEIYLETVPFRDFFGAGEREPTYIAFGVRDMWAQNCIVIGIKPKSLEEVEVLAVVDDPRVYTTVTNTGGQESQTPIFMSVIRYVFNASTRTVTFNWDAITGATGYYIVADFYPRYMQHPDQVQRLYDAISTNPYLSLAVPDEGGISFTVMARGLASIPQASINTALLIPAPIAGALSWSPAIDNRWVALGGEGIIWARADNATKYTYSISGFGRLSNPAIDDGIPYETTVPYTVQTGTVLQSSIPIFEVGFTGDITGYYKDDVTWALGDGSFYTIKLGQMYVSVTASNATSSITKTN